MSEPKLNKLVSNLKLELKNLIWLEIDMCSNVNDAQIWWNVSLF